jgi:hypothetical protein
LRPVPATGEWLLIVKDKAFRAGIPLKAELLNLVYDSADALGDGRLAVDQERLKQS